MSDKAKTQQRPSWEPMDTPGKPNGESHATYEDSMHATVQAGRHGVVAATASDANADVSAQQPRYGAVQSESAK